VRKENNMQIVIDIDDKDYQLIKDGHIPFNVLDAIKNGIPLPKRHGRLIDADDCKKNKRDFCEESTRTNWYDTIDDLLDDAPTIIEADKGE
jgi:hypothetical protein